MVNHLVRAGKVGDVEEVLVSVSAVSFCWSVKSIELGRMRRGF